MAMIAPLTKYKIAGAIWYQGESNTQNYNIYSRLMATSKDLNEFYIAGSDQKFLFASARIEGKTVVVWNKAVKESVAVRLGFSNTTIPNLFNKEGMPVNLFRTDQWEVKTDAVVK